MLEASDFLAALPFGEEEAVQEDRRSIKALITYSKFFAN